MSYASRSAETPSLEDVIQEGHFSPSQGDDDDDNTHVDGSVHPNSSVNPSCNKVADPRKGRADYGEWKHLEEDSSDFDMEAGRPSSRESSLVRSIPPQPATRTVAGLPFLPHTYDASDLAYRQQPAPASGNTRTGASPSNSSSGSQRDHSSPRRMLRLPRRRPRRQPVRDGEDSDESTDAESSPVRPLGRRRPVEVSNLNTRQGICPSEDGSDVNSDSKVQKPTVPHRQQRSNAGTRSLRKVQPSSSAKAALQHRRTASDRPPRSARRSTSHASDEASQNEGDDELPASSSTTSGHTVVIPKADYARGRRLLVPASLHSPITTVLMRGDAHFIDRQRKCVAAIPIHFYVLNVERVAVQDAHLPPFTSR